MKKSKKVALLITGSVVLAACRQHPPAPANNDWSSGASPTPSPTPNSWWHWGGGHGGGWHFWGGSGGGWSSGGASGSHSSSVSRGGFGSHGGGGGE